MGHTNVFSHNSTFVKNLHQGPGVIRVRRFRGLDSATIHALWACFGTSNDIAVRDSLSSSNFSDNFALEIISAYLSSDIDFPSTFAQWSLGILPSAKYYVTAFAPGSLSFTATDILLSVDTGPSTFSYYRPGRHESAAYIFYTEMVPHYSEIFSSSGSKCSPNLSGPSESLTLLESASWVELHVLLFLSLPYSVDEVY